MCFIERLRSFAFSYEWWSLIIWIFMRIIYWCDWRSVQDGNFPFLHSTITSASSAKVFGFFSLKEKQITESLLGERNKCIGYWSEFKWLLVLIILSPFSNMFFFYSTRPCRDIPHQSRDQLLITPFYFILLNIIDVSFPLIIIYFFYFVPLTIFLGSILHVFFFHRFE